MSAVFQWVAQKGAKLLGSETIAAMFDTTAETLGVNETTEINTQANAAAPGGTEANATTGITGASLDVLESVEVFATPDGPELIVNGDGSSTAGWTASNGSLSLSGGALRMTVTSSSVDAYLYQSFTTVIGQIYKVTFDHVLLTGSSYNRVKVGTAPNNNAEYHSTPFTTAATTHTFTFKASATTTYLTLFTNGSGVTAGDTVDYDNISVKSTYNLVTEGNGFSGNYADWTASNATLTSVGSNLRMTASSSAAMSAYQGITTVAGQTYILTFSFVTNATSGTFRAVVSSTPGVSGDLYTSTAVGTGTITLIFKATGTTSYVGLWTNSGVLVGEYMDFDTFDARITDNVIHNHNFLGTQFWTPGTGWTVSTGVAACTSPGAYSEVSQTVSELVVGKPYVVTYTISGYVSGSCSARVGSTGTGTNRSANGTYVETLICSGSLSFAIGASSTFTGNIDDISVIPLVDVDTGTYSILASESSTADARAYITLSDLSLVTDQTYTISVNARHVGAGGQWDIMIANAYPASSYITLASLTNTDTTYATYTATFKYSTALAYLLINEANANNDGGVFIDSISIKRTGNLISNGTFRDQASVWTVSSGWTIDSANGEADCAASANPLYQDVSAAVSYGETYVVTYTVTNYSAGNVTCHLRGDVGTARSANGTYSETFQPDAALGSNSINFYPGAGFTGSISNVSIRRAATRPVGASTAESTEIYGQLSKAAVNTGAGLISYSGFSSNNYLKVRNSGLPFTIGTGDFYFRQWVRFNETLSTMQGIFSYQAYNDVTNRVQFQCGASGKLSLYVTTLAAFELSEDISDGEYKLLIVTRLSGVIYVYLNGALIYSVANTANIEGATTPELLVGRLNIAGNYYLGQGNITLFSADNTGITALQAKAIYDSEKHLFSRYAYYTEANQEYTTSTTASVKEGETETVDNRNIAIGGNIEALIDRDDEFLDVSTDLIRFDALSEWREMFYAMRGDALFTFTPGQGYEPNESGSYSLENRTKQEKRQNDTIYHRFDMRLRKRG